MKVNYTDPLAQNITPEVRDGIRRLVQTYKNAAVLGRAVVLTDYTANIAPLKDSELLGEMRAELGF